AVPAGARRPLGLRRARRRGGGQEAAGGGGSGDHPQQRGRPGARGHPRGPVTVARSRGRPTQPEGGDPGQLSFFEQRFKSADPPVPGDGPPPDLWDRGEDADTATEEITPAAPREKAG